MVANFYQMEESIVQRLRESEFVQIASDRIQTAVGGLGLTSPIALVTTPEMQDGGILVFYRRSVSANTLVDGRSLGRSPSFAVMVGMPRAKDPNAVYVLMDGVIKALNNSNAEYVPLRYESDDFRFQYNGVHWYEMRFRAKMIVSNTED